MNNDSKPRPLATEQNENRRTVSTSKMLGEQTNEFSPDLRWCVRSRAPYKVTQARFAYFHDAKQYLELRRNHTLELFDLVTMKEVAL